MQLRKMLDRALRLIKWPLGAFAVAAIGGVVNVVGWYLVESRPIALAGFVIAAVGISLGIVAILLAQAIVVLDFFRTKPWLDK